MMVGEDKGSCECEFCVVGCWCGWVKRWLSIVMLC